VNPAKLQAGCKATNWPLAPTLARTRRSTSLTSLTSLVRIIIENKWCHDQNSDNIEQTDEKCPLGLAGPLRLKLPERESDLQAAFVGPRWNLAFGGARSLAWRRTTIITSGPIIYQCAQFNGTTPLAALVPPARPRPFHLCHCLVGAQSLLPQAHEARDFIKNRHPEAKKRTQVAILGPKFEFSPLSGGR